MKRIIIAILIATGINPLVAQVDPAVDKYLKQIPKSLRLLEPVPQEYRVTTDYINMNIFGDFVSRTVVVGNYTRGNPGGMVKWNHVQITNTSEPKAPLVDWVTQDYMENFTYSPKSNLMDAAAFPSFPPGSFQTKNLVWDMLALEMVAWLYTDSLKLNEPFLSSSLNGEINTAGEGTFENKDFQITWTGISKMNKELCLLIEFHAFDNPLIINTEQLKIKGRSHYWGAVWVSLKDKQIERAILYEDVVMKMNVMGMSDEQLLDTRREIIVEKIK